MMGTQRTSSSWTSIFGIACLLSTPAVFSGTQTAPKGHELVEVDEDYVGASGTLTRCGKYFLLETTTYGELEVKQLHLAYTMAQGGVAIESKSNRDLEVVIDDTTAIPTLILTRENPGLEHDRLELSEASYEEAKACVPPPKRDDAT